MKKQNLNIVHEEEFGIQFIRLTGYLDTVTTPDAETRIIDVIDKGGKLIINLEDLLYISSAGCRLILVSIKKAKKMNTRIVFCAPAEQVMKIFQMSNFLEFMDIVASEDEAISKMRSDI